MIEAIRVSQHEWEGTLRGPDKHVLFCAPLISTTPVDCMEKRITSPGDNQVNGIEKRGASNEAARTNSLLSSSQPIFIISYAIMGVTPSKTTAEILRDNKNAIRTSIREIDREERQIQRRRTEVEAKIKKSAKEGRVVGEASVVHG